MSERCDCDCTTERHRARKGIIVNKLNDKHALITGGASGIGFETARQFLADGPRLAITRANPATIGITRAELGGEVIAIRADAGDAAANNRTTDNHGETRRTASLLDNQREVKS